MAAWNNQLEMVQLLIANGADVNIKDNDNRTPLHSAACVAEAATVVNTLIDNGAEINLIGMNMTPLHIAANRNHHNIAEQLIERGADLEAKGKTGETPLHTAARFGSPDVAEILIKNGADVNVRGNFRGDTPLHYAVSRRYIKIVQLLLDYGANVNSRDFSGNTPLESAMNSQEAEEILVILVNHGGML